MNDTKVFVIIIIISTAISFEITPIREIGGNIRLIEFDHELNTYVATYEESNTRLYKLDPEKNVLWRYYIEGNVEKILINTKNDVYLFLTSDDNISINIIENGTLDIVKIDINIPPALSAILDNDDNLIYGGGDFGMKILRPGENESIAIGNIENFQVYGPETEIVDKDGNVYLGGIIKGTIDNEFVVITKEEMQEDVPQSKIVEGVLENPTSEFVQEILLNDKGEIFLSTLDMLSPVATIQKIFNGTRITLLNDTDYQNHHGYVANDKVVCTSSVNLFDLCIFRILTSDYEFIPIMNLQNATVDACRSLQFESDEKGNVYIGSLYKLDSSPLEILYNGELESFGVHFNVDDINIMSILLDKNNTLWVLSYEKGLFYVEEGAVNATKVQDSENLHLVNMRKNKNNNDIFLYSRNNLYVISD